MIYVMADIHGNERRFRSVLDQIGLTPEDTLYILGDVVDRHPHGIKLLREIMAMDNVKMLLGNHEYMMLRALGYPYDSYADDGNAMDHWYRNGGEVTHYGWDRLDEAARTEVRKYLQNLPLCFDVEVAGKAYKLVHGAPVEMRFFEPSYKTIAHFAVWKRLGGFDQCPKGEILVFGHTPTQYYQDNVPLSVWFGPGMIGIDCGSGYPEGGIGRLACIRLDDGKVFYSEEVRP